MGVGRFERRRGAVLEPLGRGAQSLLHPASQEDADKMNPDSVFSSFTLMLVLPIGYVKSDTRRQGGLND